MGSELTITEKQDGFTQQQVAALQQLGMKNASQGDLEVFFHQVQKTGLDPFARQIYMIERQGRQTIQTGIDGFRLIARRAVDRTHEAFGEPHTLWCGEDGVWRDIWLSTTPPSGAKVIVQRGEGIFEGVATFASYAGRKRDGSLTPIWSSKPDVMLAKCAEALALRKAFPQDLSGLLTPDEMQSADVVDAQPVQGEAITVEPSPSRDDCLKISKLLQQGGVDSKGKASISLTALTGRDITSTSELTMVEAEQLLSDPELVVSRTKQALAVKHE